MPLPKVVRLIAKYVQRAVSNLYRQAPWTKRSVLMRDKHTCAYCLKKADTIDHLLPKSRGGENTFLNTVACCKRCNSDKDNRTVAEYGRKPQTKVWHPTMYDLWTFEHDFGLQ